MTAVESALAFASPRMEIIRTTVHIGETIVGGRGLSNAGQAETEWLHDVRVQVKELLLLDSGWDSSVAAPISEQSVEDARQLLNALYEGVEGLRRPYVSPTANGGVNLEWHTATAHFDVTLEPDNVWVYAEDTAFSWEGPLTEVPREALAKLFEHFSAP